MVSSAIFDGMQKEMSEAGSYTLEKRAATCCEDCGSCGSSLPITLVILMEPEVPLIQSPYVNAGILQRQLSSLMHALPPAPAFHVERFRSRQWQ